jgi:hypothetical protein
MPAFIEEAGRNMSHQIFLIALKAAAHDDDAVRDELASLLHRLGGFVLMATASGALIAAFDDQWQPLFQRHAAVESCGALSLDPQGAAAAKLRHLFAANVAAQLAARGGLEAGAPAPGPAHRPLVWHRPAQHRPDGATGIRISTQPVAR